MARPLSDRRLTVRMSSSSQTATPPETASVGNKLDQIGINLVLGGFPKCATTSLASWINESPLATVSNPKETYQLCPEFRPNRKDLDDSLADCFPARRTPWRVEASTLNVYSTSLRAALAARGDIKLILSIRDPRDAVVSWHNQTVQADAAVSDDLAPSWEAALEIDRTWNGTASDPIALRRNYARAFSFGYWIGRWVEAIGHERLLILSMEQLNSQPTTVRETLDRFLGSLSLPDAPPKLNRYASIRCESFYKQLRQSYFNRAFRQIERRFPAAGNLRRTVKERIFRKPKKKQTDDEIGEQLAAYFKEDQVVLRRILADNSAHWGS